MNHADNPRAHSCKENSGYRPKGILDARRYLSESLIRPHEKNKNHPDRHNLHAQDSGISNMQSLSLQELRVKNNTFSLFSLFRVCALIKSTLHSGSAHLEELWRKDKPFKQPLQVVGIDTPVCGIFANRWDNRKESFYVIHDVTNAGFSFPKSSYSFPNIPFNVI